MNRTLLLLAASALVAGVGLGLNADAALGITGTPAPADTARPAVVEYVATDFAFTGPDTVAAGATTFRLVNKGPDMHHLYLVRLEDGKTLADLVAAMQANPHHPPAFMRDMGGPNVPAPGGATEVTVELAPGNYVLLCVIPGPDGVPHVAKGMMKPLTVVPGEPGAPMPAADVELTLVDYGYEFSKPLVAGRQRVLVRTAAEQSHEVVFLRLNEGRTAKDVFAWIEQGGEPPAVPVGGISPMAKGVTNFLELDLEPGAYLLVCFVPDHKDGKAHIAHGMVQTIEVAAR